MLPAPSSRSQVSGGTSKQANNTGGGYRWINVSELSTQKEPVKILAAKVPEPGEPNRFKNDVVLKVEFRDETRLKGLKTTDPLYKTIFDAWGGDEKDWTGKEFNIYLEKNEFNGRFFARADVNGERPKRR